MTSRHSSQGGRRGIATWIIVTAIAAVVLIAGTVGYVLIVGDNDSADATCGAQVVLPVVTAPGAAAAITQAAESFDATAPVARSTCVSTSVTTESAADAAAALSGDWPTSAGDPPAVWITDSEADLLALEVTDSAMTAGRDTAPLATSPVVLAVRTADAAAVEAAGLSWQGLPAASGPNGTLVLPGGAHLLVALPDPVTNRATSYALQSVLLPTSGGMVDAASAAGAGPALGGLTAPVSDGSQQPDTTLAALTDLAAGTGSFTAVPVLASDLTRFSADNPGLTAISPTGATVGDAVFAAPLTATWVTPTLEDASALFLAYLRGPGGDTAFTNQGYQVGSAGSAADAGPAVAAALATAIGATPAG
jgi:hypothetical protein